MFISPLSPGLTREKGTHKTDNNENHAEKEDTMISELAQRILRIILEAKEPVPGKSLARRCDISLGTVRKEIGLINEEVACRGFRIESKASFGYSLLVEVHEIADPFIEQLR